MTDLYTWNPMPHRVAVSCPGCAREAVFEFAERIQIGRREDIPYFQNSRHFDYEKATRGSVGLHHYAWYYHGLGRGQLDAIADLPEPYDPSLWAHSEYLYRGHGTDRGTLYCTACDWRRKHVLHWPDDAYFAIAYKDKMLWAFNRAMAQELVAFIKSDDRNFSRFRYGSSFRKVPKEFLSAKARSPVVKKLATKMQPPK